jgi:hypothetical protein
MRSVSTGEKEGYCPNRVRTPPKQAVPLADDLASRVKELFRMGKKRKGNSKSKAKSKQKHGTEDRHGHVQYTHVWVFALPLIAAIFGIVAGMIYGSQKILAIWMLFATVVLVMLAICLYWQSSVKGEAEHPPFSIAVETAVRGTKRDAGLFSVAYNNNLLCPVSAVLYLRIVNLQAIPADITQLTVETESSKSRWIFPASWVKGTNIPDSMPLFSVGDPQSKSLRMELIGDRIQPILSTSPIQPNQTARGWLLVDMPPAYDSSPEPELLRITVRDSAGHSFSVVTSGPSGDENILHERGFKPAGKYDLTGYSISHLSN